MNGFIHIHEHEIKVLASYEPYTSSRLEGGFVMVELGGIKAWLHFSSLDQAVTFGRGLTEGCEIDISDAEADAIFERDLRAAGAKAAAVPIDPDLPW
jgi:hypothetical protein